MSKLYYSCVSISISKSVLLIRLIGLDDLEAALQGIKPAATASEIHQLLAEITEGAGLQATREALQSWIIQVKGQ